MKNNLATYKLTFTNANLLIAIIAIHIINNLFSQTLFGTLLYSSMWLDPSLVSHSLQLWRLVSYGFIHDINSPMHVILNSLVIYSIGSYLENHLGTRKFIILVFLALIGGSFFVLTTYLLGFGNSIVVGFSAVSIALVIQWGIAFPNQKMYIFGLIPLSGKNIVFLTILIEILSTFSSNNISNSAHLGGIFSALLFSVYNYRKTREYND